MYSLMYWPVSGSVLDQLRATDLDNTVLTFSIDGDIANQLLNLQRVSDTSADVILNEPFDKEVGQTLLLCS